MMMLPKVLLQSQRHHLHSYYRLLSTSSTTHFGFETVPLEKKQERVREVFERVADNYDVMNDLMSGGLHRLWKDALLDTTKVAEIAKTARRLDRSYSILDVAGGTGDVAFRFVEAADCQERSKSSGQDCIQITVCDINAEMLRVGRQRARERFGSALMKEEAASESTSSTPSTAALSFVQGNAQSLDDFGDNTFDLYTIAFGLRNVTDVDAALREAHRVLKPGGRFLCLEFSHVPNNLLRTIYDAYSFHAIPFMGHVVANDRASYQYLVESIRKFSKQQELVERMQEAGLVSCSYENWTGGIVALHSGYKGL